MSYSILYRAMHVKTSRGILPMVECGDNNVYECDNRRARSWYNFHANEKSIYSNWEEIENALLKWNDGYHEKQAEYRNSEDDCDGSFGYFESIAVYGKSTCGTTFNDFRNLIRSGMKYMATIEEVIEKKMLYIEGGWEGLKHLPNILVENEQMLFDALDNKKWVFFNDLGANNLYEYKKAINLMAKPRKGQRVYKMYIKDNENKIKFISMNDERTKFTLVDNVEDAMGFTYNGVNKWWLMRQSFDIKEMCFDYVS